MGFAFYSLPSLDPLDRFDEWAQRISVIIDLMPIRETKQAAEEDAVFQAYLRVHTDFARSVASIEQPEAEFPDFIIRLNDGTQIDFELAEWIHEAQMANGKRRERLVDAILRSIGDQGDNPSQYFDSILLFPRADAPRFPATDADRFRAELWALIVETEQRWQNERFWNSPAGCQRYELDAYPVLKQYVLKANFYPRERRPSGVPWIDVSLPCTSYSSDSAIEALAKILETKVANYGGFLKRAHLLVFYGAAAAYNTPWYDIQFRTFSDIAQKAAELARDQCGFEKIYLLKALEPGLEAYEIYPSFAKCE